MKFFILNLLNLQQIEKITKPGKKKNQTNLSAEPNGEFSESSVLMRNSKNRNIVKQRVIVCRNLSEAC